MTDNTRPSFSFNAHEHQPSSGATQDQVPDGIYNTKIIDTDLKPTANKDGFMLILVHEIQDGTQIGKKLNQRFNLFNKSEDAVRIAQSELSAVCHCVGIFNLSDTSQGPAGQLLNSRLQVKVVNKTMDRGGLSSEIKGVMDIHGNKPGQAGSPAQPAQVAPQNPQQYAATPPVPPAPQSNAAWATQPVAPQPQLQPATNQWGTQPVQQPQPVIQSQPQFQGQQPQAQPDWAKQG
jgi:hypothetical protein